MPHDQLLPAKGAAPHSAARCRPVPALDLFCHLNSTVPSITPPWYCHFRPPIEARSASSHRQAARPSTPALGHVPGLAAFGVSGPQCASPQLYPAAPPAGETLACVSASASHTGLHGFLCVAVCPNSWRLRAARQTARSHVLVESQTQRLCHLFAGGTDPPGQTGCPVLSPQPQPITLCLAPSVRPWPRCTAPTLSIAFFARALAAYVPSTF